MRVKYEIDENEIIINKLADDILQMKNIDKQLEVEIASIAPIWDSAASKIFMTNFNNAKGDYTEKIKYMSDAIELLKKVQGISIEAKELVNEAIKQMEG